MKIIVKSKAVTFRRKVYAPGGEIDVPDTIGKNLIKSDACEVPIKKAAAPVIPAKAGIQRKQKGDKKC
ncbi:MAG: hypothetical protein JRE40_03830 [Deltaproteobacteria bacterium]|nr:hypothetical protein [Deltaproteobacteria bacterium]